MPRRADRPDSCWPDRAVGTGHSGRLVTPKRPRQQDNGPKIARVTEPRYAVVIEDDADTSVLIDMVLTQSGFTVVTATDGLAGIEAVRKYDPLLTTLDVQMPGMDGFAVAKRLREFSLTYLIMLTSMAGEIDIIQGFEAGADDYLVKPFRPRRAPGPRGRDAAPDADRRAGRHGDGPGRRRRPSPSRGPASPRASCARTRSRRAPAWSRRPPLRPMLRPGWRSRPPPHRRRARPPPTCSSRRSPPGARWPRSPASCKYAGLALDSETGRTTYQGRSLDLTPEEFDLLNTLLHTGRRVRSKADLVLALRGHVSSHFVNEADKRRVDTLVASLRAKRGTTTKSRPKVIETVRGVGYRLANRSTAPAR